LFIYYSFILLFRDHFAEGYRLQNLNRLDEALASYDMAIKHNPTYSMAYNNRGVCLEDLNRFEDAIASYDMAIKHNSNNVNAINNRKLLLEKLESKSKSKSKSQCKQQ
jgi:tetratricopeptide (TPR) repeat protein